MFRDERHGLPLYDSREQAVALPARGWSGLGTAATIGATVGALIGLYYGWLLHFASGWTAQYPRPTVPQVLLGYLQAISLGAIGGAAALIVVAGFVQSLVIVFRAKPDERGIDLKIARAVVLLGLFASFVAIARVIMG